MYKNLFENIEKRKLSYRIDVKVTRKLSSFCFLLLNSVVCVINHETHSLNVDLCTCLMKLARFVYISQPVQ